MSGGLNAQCYAQRSNKLRDAEWKACGVGNSTIPFVPCCASGDDCLGHGLCHYSHSKVGGSGYYVSGCTDSTFADKNCPKICVSRAYPDITWNSTLKLWQCCGVNSKTNSINCNTPTNEQFDAPGPTYLRTYWPPAPARKEEKSNTGVIVGSVISGVVMLLLLIAALVLWRRRKSKQEMTKSMLADDFRRPHSPEYGNWIHRSTSGASSTPETAELSDSAALLEMEAQSGSANRVVQNKRAAAELSG